MGGNKAVNNGDLSAADALAQIDAIKLADAQTNQKVSAAKLKELDELTKLVTTLEKAENGDDDTTTNTLSLGDDETSQTLDFIQNVSTSAQETAKKQQGQELLATVVSTADQATDPGTVPVSINGQTYIIDVIPFKAFVEQLKQRLEQTLVNISMQKTQIAAYSGDNVAADGSVTKSANGGIIGQIVSAVIAGGDAQAQQTMVSAAKDLSSGLTNLGGTGITEAVEGSTSIEEANVSKAENAIAAAKNVPVTPKVTITDEEQEQEQAEPRTAEMETAIKSLKNGDYDFTKPNNHFGSEETTDNKTKSYTKRDEDDPDQTSEVNNTNVTVEDALKAATPAERLEIETQWKGQLKKAEKALDSKKENNNSRRRAMQSIIQSASTSISGGVSILNAALQKEQATQQAIQTEGSNVNDTLKGMMSSSDAATSGAKQAYKDDQNALQEIIRIVNQRT